MTAFRSQTDWIDTIFDEEDEDTAKNRFLTFQVGNETYEGVTRNTIEKVTPA